MRKTKVICFANNKGGSGKSTTCSNVGAALAEAGKHILLIDGDMQLNLSLSVLEEEDVLRYAKSEKNLYRAINAQADLTDYIVQTATANIDIVPSSTLMSSIECDLFTKMQRELILRKCLKKVRESGVYDYILIDAPPTLGGWVINILCASDYLVIPVESSPWGLFGLANMFDFVDTTKDIAPQLTMLGVLITKIDERKNYYRQTMESLAELPDIHVFKNCIHVDSNVEWAQDNCRTVVSYKKSSRSAREYVALAKEIDRLCQ
ncbi:MAG: ParA family protein [Lachnospiraceae bacterium]|nr:ParA family protein [Lachnospiraceae bacterium]